MGHVNNGVPTESRELTPGDRVDIGDMQLQIETDLLSSRRSPRSTNGSSQRFSTVRRRNGSTRSDQSVKRQTDRTARPTTIDQTPAGPIDLETLVGKKFLRYRVDSIPA